MKKALLVLLMIPVAFDCFAQLEKTDAYTSLSERSICFNLNSNMYEWSTFDNKIGLTVYGSRYRKALSCQAWGKTLTLGVAPGLLCIAALITEWDLPGVQLINAGLAAASLGAGIPLWVKGRKELDSMLDDYARYYAPLPRASSIPGVTGEGLGLRLNF